MLRRAVANKICTTILHNEGKINRIVEKYWAHCVKNKLPGVQVAKKLNEVLNKKYILVSQF